MKPSNDNGAPDLDAAVSLSLVQRVGSATSSFPAALALDRRDDVEPGGLLSEDVDTPDRTAVRPRLLSDREGVVAAEGRRWAHRNRSELEVMLAIGELMRDAISVAEVFEPLVEILGRILPLHAVVIASRNAADANLAWCEPREGDGSLENVAAVVSNALASFVGEGEFVALAPVTTVGPQWTFLPLVPGKGPVAGMLGVAVHPCSDACGQRSSPSGDASRTIHEGRLVVIACAANHVSSVLSVSRRQRMHEDVVAALKQRDEILSTVSHELKNPLGVILGSATSILDALPESDDRRTWRRQVEAILRSANRMQTLVGDLLDLAALDGGGLTIRPSVCNIGNVIQDVVESQSALAARAKVRLIVVGDSAAFPDVWIDAGRIMQVLTNLIGNAFKFTPCGGTIQVGVALAERDRVTVHVADTGRGMPPEDVARVFERFWQAPGSSHLGAGLGLTICRAIVERSGGRIWVTSERGRGTMVTFTLPRSEP